jgi:ribosomal protein L11 methyltransferase
MSPGTTPDTLAAFRVEAPAAAEEALVTALWERGTSGVHVQGGPGETVILLAYFAVRPGLAAELGSCLRAQGATRVEPAAVPDVDWVARFREGFKAFAAGGFRIVPAWEPGPTGTLTRRTLRILPGRAFGTGTHESTRLCLSALEEIATRGRLGRVVDLGAGTGILAIAAAHLGARAVTAIDIDPDAVESVQRHARLNAIDLHLVRGDGGRPLARGRFDLVLANLTAPLLLERKDEITGLCSPTARLVLAGFLRQDAAEIAAAYSALAPAEARFDGEWAALLIGAAP